MTGRRRFRVALPASLAASVALHVVVIIPLIMTLLGSAASRYDVRSRLKPEDFVDDDPPPSPEVEIGIDAPTPPSLTWIGHKAYEEHLARLAAVDQAAHTPSPPRVVPATDSSVTSGAAAPSPNTTQDAVPNADDAPAAHVAQVAELMRLIELMRKGPTAPRPVAPQESEETPNPLIEALRRAVAERDPAEKPAAVTGEPGELSEKESVATSIEVTLEQLHGKPIARKGLELTPKRPQFTEHVRVTAVAGNPLVQIRFGRNGVVADASILESSGDERVDHAIEASLFRWSAKGSDLQDLDADETIDVEIRIILNNRRRKQ